MSQWIKKLPLPPIYLAFLLLWLYFAVYRGGWLVYAGLFLLLVRLISRYPRSKWLPSLAILTLFAGFFWLRREIAEQESRKEQAVHQLLLLPDTIRINGDSLSFRGRSQSRLYQVFYKLRSKQEKEGFSQLADPVLLDFEGEVGSAEGQRNFSGFDYQAYLKTQGIYQLVNIHQISRIQKTNSLQVLDWLSVWRRKALVFIKMRFPEPMSHYMTGLLFGNLDTDFAEMSELYSSLGIIHLFALSGMQVGFFMEGFRKLLLRLGLKTETVNLLQYPFSLLYAGLTGFSVSVVRSLIQKLLSQLGVTRLDNFALTVMILSLLLPNFLLTAGGVLSCAYAFILSMLDLEQLSSFRRILTESFALSLGILPLLIYYFSEFQPWSILLTFLFSLIFDLVMLPALTVIFLLSPFLILDQVNVFFEGLEAIVHWVASWSPRPLIFGQPALWQLLLLLLILALLHDFWKQKKTRLALILSLGLLFFLVKHPLQNEITLVDIGQGDSIFLRDWTGRTVLIDVGGRVEIGKKEGWQERVRSANAEQTLIPYLKSRGVGSLDALVLTHTDTDHMGDMLEVAKHLSIKKIYVSKGSMTQPDFVAKLKKMKRPVQLVEIGDRLPIFDGHLEVLYPSQIGDGGNDDSIVLYGKFLQTSFLFTGDLEAHGESELLQLFPHLQADVLKAGHHGSKGSSSPEFLAQIQPKISLVSAGKNNRYQHPHQETLERFDGVGSQVLRTDQQGAIRFIGWKKWRVETVK